MTLSRRLVGFKERKKERKKRERPFPLRKQAPNNGFVGSLMTKVAFGGSGN
jgi:hypothetical protein